MLGRTNVGSGAAGGTLTVTAPAGVTVTVSKDGKTKTRVAGASGVVTFKGLKTGTWTVTISDGDKTASKAVEITTDYSVAVPFNAIPTFDYTGTWEVVSDDDQPITVSQDNFKIRLLSSGTLTFTELNGAEDGIDVFLVGGGGGAKWNSSGGGGGGGYTTTERGVSVAVGVAYDIVIGDGGVAASDGGTTSAFGYSALGGKCSNGSAGGAGGSGGGGYVHAESSSTNAGNGGSDGSDGATSSPNGGKGGAGQGTTTREFGESTGTLYAGGGAGASNRSGVSPTGGAGGGGDTRSDGAPNTGGGAGGQLSGQHTGGSGIVIIRNARAQSAQAQLAEYEAALSEIEAALEVSV